MSKVIYNNSRTFSSLIFIVDLNGDLNRLIWIMSTLLLSSVHTLSVNILRCVRLYIKQKYYYY